MSRSVVYSIVYHITKSVTAEGAAVTRGKRATYARLDAGYDKRPPKMAPVLEVTKEMG